MRWSELKMTPLLCYGYCVSLFMRLHFGFLLVIDFLCNLCIKSLFWWNNNQVELCVVDQSAGKMAKRALETIAHWKKSQSAAKLYTKRNAFINSREVGFDWKWPNGRLISTLKRFSIYEAILLSMKLGKVQIFRSLSFVIKAHPFIHRAHHIFAVLFDTNCTFWLAIVSISND